MLASFLEIALQKTKKRGALDKDGAVLFRGVEWFRGLTVFWPFWAFPLLGQGLGRGIWTDKNHNFFERNKKRKFRKPTVFGTFVVAGEGFEPTTSGL